MPDLQHLWQRFLLAAALLAGLAIGIGATVFGYSNLNTVDIHWSVLHLDGVPLWAVVIVPITLILVAGTIFHWLDGLHHFTEHMRHRRRVHELEAEVGRLRAHLDQVLEMPRGEALKAEEKPSLPAADLAATDAEMAAVEPSPEPDTKPARAGKTRRAKLIPDTIEAKTTENGDGEATAPAAPAEPAEPAAAAAATPNAPNDAG
jgi:uncharacterized membrane protein